ncbi:hypothetical protein BRE01_68130 [Brevibacillus reuszeri]|uniref:DUF1259 domain-containing protein n=1 Tax=Brevibacillus reuszeri TaxID=54915 RepID=A0A0K9YVN0_9BACL|nr:DUF1259 domain-containing protein [Brevibacillus reuszeri]KNB72270.1 hypothetical protein ADS79_10215 [Brevibacillus reuszeri]MED1855920.1 DUF1259 domain-containing protein [Brevibacillus reuszeri]GED73111.1 hypothetical protein BRE01_68130 [Brevibacillus reuszeri]
MKIPKSLCARLAKILGGTGMSNDTCSIMVKRNLNARILGKKYDTEQEIVIQSLDRRGNTLNTAEITLLQREVQKFINAARRQGLRITALHNHWLFDNPRLMYLHIETVEPPIQFAKKLRRALNVLK